MSSGEEMEGYGMKAGEKTTTFAEAYEEKVREAIYVDT